MQLEKETLTILAIIRAPSQRRRLCKDAVDSCSIFPLRIILLSLFLLCWVLEIHLGCGYVVLLRRGVKLLMKHSASHNVQG